MLQEADPTGESHIRMDGGIPAFAEKKQGYWDGPYSYIDDDGCYVYSSLDDKVDIYCTSIWDFVEINTGLDTKWEDIEKKFKFKLSNYVNVTQQDEKKNKILEKAKKAFNEVIELDKKYLKI